ncbi:hypothetical protein COLO4_20110 [Corchorus olitorius]|uniref:Uncharacterized protein n=1 Tax=Corchorus olitorius TaxID=93759 RepID=A0A1R3J1K6_9ROSI|nr:hypothetical protein COLO4_20110 [Corchorus olitorius]
MPPPRPTRNQHRPQICAIRPATDPYIQVSIERGTCVRTISSTICCYTANVEQTAILSEPTISNFQVSALILLLLKFAIAG